MRALGWTNTSQILSLAAALLVVTACNGQKSVESHSISLRNSEQYEFPTVGGDEEGARISVQAKHFITSEVRRTPETNWIATYVYRPEPAFVGTDYAEIEVLTGSDGATEPSAAKKVRLYFTVHE